jgi:DNA-binding MarR family transcriptional regulator
VVDHRTGQLGSEPDATADQPADPPLPHLFASLDALQRRLGSEISGQMRPHGAQLRGSHGRILGLLPPEGSRPSALAAGWISKQAVGKRIQEMAAAGLVSVEPDPDDRRATIVRRTVEGNRLRSVANEAIAEIEASLAAEVGAERYQVFRDVLDEMAARD